MAHKLTGLRQVSEEANKGLILDVVHFYAASRKWTIYKWKMEES